MNNPLLQPRINRPFTRLVRPLARFLPTEVLWHLPVVGPVEIALPEAPETSVVMLNPGNDRVASMLFWRGGVEGWEPTTIRLFLGLVRPGSTVLDVGANTGLFSLLAARREAAALVHALEPVSRVFRVLEGNIAANGLENVTCHRLACGEKAGRMTIHVPEDEAIPMMASLVAGWSVGRQRLEEVECVTVDGLVEEIRATRVDVLKIDAEGSEDGVLRGARTTLEQHRPFVFCEVLDRRDLGSRVMEALHGLDYRFFALSPSGVRPSATVLGGADDDESHNYLFVPRARLMEVAPVLSGARAHVPAEQDVLSGHMDRPVGETDPVLHPVDPQGADRLSPRPEDHR
jgi:FkbM family methyltransferase